MKLPPELATPYGFAVGVLGYNDIYDERGQVVQRRKPYVWQGELMNQFKDVDKRQVLVSCVSPNGGGRSSYCIATVALFILTLFPLGRVTITTVAGNQLDDQIWPAIEAHKHRFPHWTWRYREIDTDTGGMLRAFVTDEPRRVEGWHRLPGATKLTGPHVMIIDEAKSYEELMFQAVDRCTYDGLLYVSSAGLMEGRFFESHQRPDMWHLIAVGLKDCPHIPQEKIDHVIAQYGADSPVTGSILHGRFMNFDGVSKFVFQADQLQAAKRSELPILMNEEVVAFCDFAAGGDENVLAIRRGNKVTLAAAWRDENTMSAAYRFIHLFRTHRLKPQQIFGDNDGLGHVMIDAMGELGWKINRVVGNSKSKVDGYANRNAEMWHETSGMVRRGEIILPLDDPTTYTQLATRKVAWMARGLGVKPKDKMRADGEPSPDRADAVCGAAVCKDVVGELARQQLAANRFERYAREQGDDGKAEDNYATLEAML